MNECNCGNKYPEIKCYHNEVTRSYRIICKECGRTTGIHTGDRRALRKAWDELHEIKEV